jgi:hypothetical protein
MAEAGATILVGEGWSGATATPAAVGSAGIGYSYAPIARWLNVPDADYDDDIPVGLLAQHINGIDKVEFAVEGGDWVEIDGPDWNPATRCHEYWVTIPATELFDGNRVEVRARITPNTRGQCVVLQGTLADEAADRDGIHSMYVNYITTAATANQQVWCDSVDGNDSTGDGTSGNPYASIAKALDVLYSRDNTSDGGNGCIIWLEAGNYEDNTVNWGTHEPQCDGRFLTVQPTAGTDRTEVIIGAASSTQYGRMGFCGRLHLKDVTIECELTSHSSIDTTIWCDGCLFTTSDHTGDNWITEDVYGKFSTPANLDRAYATDCDHEYVETGPYQAVLALNCTVTHGSSDAMKEVLCAANMTISDVGPQGTANHVDGWQEVNAGPDNIILYNVKTDETCDLEPFFTRNEGDIDGLWICNCEFHTTGYTNSVLHSQWATPTNHGIIEYCDFLDTPLHLVFSDEALTNSWWDGDDLTVRFCLIQWLMLSDPEGDSGETTPTCTELASSPCVADNNHYYNVDNEGTPIGSPLSCGTNVTTGATAPSTKGRDAWQAYYPEGGPVEGGGGGGGGVNVKHKMAAGLSLGIFG